MIANWFKRAQNVGSNRQPGDLVINPPKIIDVTDKQATINWETVFLLPR